MKRKTIRNIIILAAALLLSLITTQIVWVGKAFEFQEKQFNYDIKDALKNVAQQILKHKKDSSLLIDPVKQISSNQFNVSINDILHPYYLESLLNKEFGKHQIDLGYEYAIYDCFTDSVVFSKIVTSGNSSDAEMPNPAEMKWEKDGHYFSVYFPSKSQHLLKRMGFWIFSTTILFIVILFFVYTISIILKQKRISEIKNDFINNMTHELKTPISTIGLSSEVLLRPDILENPERFKNYAQIIYHENSRLKMQVDRVLQMASLEKEEIQLNTQLIDVHEVIKNSVNTFKLIVEEREGSLKTELFAVNPKIFADEVHLTNIIHNLLDNANKYSPQKPEIIIITQNLDSGKFENKKSSKYVDGIVVSVADRGLGIKSEDQSFIFDKFYRVPTGNLHDVKGFGLGLNYVKTMVNAHGGKIKVKSVPGKGSNFEIWFPKNGKT